MRVGAASSSLRAVDRPGGRALATRLRSSAAGTFVRITAIETYTSAPAGRTGSSSRSTPMKGCMGSARGR
jgi:hypothetical protein